MENEYKFKGNSNKENVLSENISSRAREGNYLQTIEIMNPKNNETGNFHFDRIFTENDNQEDVINIIFLFFKLNIPFIE